MTKKLIKLPQNVPKVIISCVNFYYSDNQN